jgi:hypothetical protein
MWRINANFIKQIPYILIFIICLTAGALIAIKYNEIANTLIVQPGYAPAEIDLIVIIPSIIIAIGIIITGYIMGKLFE